MNISHESRSNPSRVREPVQVYLDVEEQQRLARLQEELETTKSDVLRKGLEALERQLIDPERHPALAIIGLIGPDKACDGGIDRAREHDEVLATEEEGSWGAGTGTTE